jgi:hypothetical protein
MRSMFLVIALVLVAGCGAKTEAVSMSNPDTGQVVECGPYGPYRASTPEAGSALALAELRGCIDDYRVQGFVRTP